MPTVLRLAHPEDAAGLLAVYAPFITETTITFETEVPDLAECARRVRDTLSAFPWLVCEQDGHIAGYACAHPFGERAAYGWSAEPSIYLAPTAHGKGLGTRLYRVLEALLDRQGYRNLYARVTWPNPASEAFHEKMGYQKQGLLPEAGYKFGRAVGVTYYHKALPGAGLGPPFSEKPPRPFSALPADEVEAILAGL